MNDINDERFNFFCGTTKDENTTEQLIALFMPEFSVISNIILIVKHAFTETNIFAEIKDLLKRLKYQIIDELEFKHLEDGDADSLIDHL